MIHYDDEVSRRSLGVPRRGRHTLVIENHYEFLVRASKCKIFDNFPYFGRFRTLHANNSGKRRLAAALRVSRALAGPQQPQRRPLLAYGWSMTVFSLTAQVNKHRNKNHWRNTQGRIRELLGQAEALRRPCGVFAHLVSVKGPLCGAGIARERPRGGRRSLPVLEQFHLEF